MPYLLASAAAVLAGWLVDEAVRPLAGSAGSLAMSTAAAAVAFFYARRFLADLRG